MNDEVLRSIRRLDVISALQEGWNGSDAKPFDPAFLGSVKTVVCALRIQPEIFPLSTGGIQLEYDGPDGSYLEFEITESFEVNVFKIDRCNTDTYFSTNFLVESIDKIVTDFYNDQGNNT